MWLNNILETIGNTPLIKLNKITKDLPATVVAKVDYFNPGNSIKDRMALKMVEVAEQEGKLKPGGTIIEGTSGNTGMGLALAACVKGYKCIFVTTDKQSKEKADILKAVGAEVIVCPTNVLPDDPKSYYSVAKRLAREIPNSMYMNQYDNLANRLAHYESTGPEIWEQTEGKIDQVEESGHGCYAFKQRIVHVHIQYLCTALHLLPRYRKGFFVFTFPDEPREFLGTGYIGTFAYIDKIRFRPYNQWFQSGKA